MMGDREMVQVVECMVLPAILTLTYANEASRCSIAEVYTPSGRLPSG